MINIYATEYKNFGPLTSLFMVGKFGFPSPVPCRLLKLLKSSILFNFSTISSFSLFVSASLNNYNGMISSIRYQRWLLNALQADFSTKAFLFSSYHEVSFNKVITCPGVVRKQQLEQ